MAKLYARKIRDYEINLATGEAWTIGDVPDKWKTATQKELEENSQE